MRREEALAIRKMIENAASKLNDDEALDSLILFPNWTTGVAYNVDDRVRENNKLWKCLQPHTSQEGWNPSSTPALWVEVARPGEYREIKDNMSSTEMFAKDEIGWYKEKTNLYKSLIDNNIYTPITYPMGWQKI